jgi:hypothetical protein
LAQAWVEERRPKLQRRRKKTKIEKLILLSPAAVSNPEQMQGKILFIVSKEEPKLHQISAQFEKAPEPKKLHIMEGSAHAQNIFKTMQKNTLIRIILDFLSQ